MLYACVSSYSSEFQSLTAFMASDAVTGFNYRLLDMSTSMDSSNSGCSGS